MFVIRFGRLSLTFGIAVAAAACGQGNSDNVMASSANAYSPADVNLALGPEENMAANEINNVSNVTDSNTDEAGASDTNTTD
jgi:hypothetical protein